MWSKWATRSENDAFGSSWAMAMSIACRRVLSIGGITMGLLMAGLGRCLKALTSSFSSSDVAFLFLEELGVGDNGG